MNTRRTALIIILIIALSSLFCGGSERGASDPGEAATTVAQTLTAQVGASQPGEPTQPGKTPTTASEGGQSAGGETPGGGAQPPDQGETKEPPVVVDPSAPGDPVRGGVGEIDLVFDVQDVQTGESAYTAKVALVVVKEGDGTLSSDFSVVWFPHGNTGIVGCSWDVPAARVNTGGPATQVCEYPYTNHGTMHWRAVVDSEDEIEETDEVNNTVRGTLLIEKPENGGGEVVLYLPPPSNCQWRVGSTPGSIVVSYDYPNDVEIEGFRVYMATSQLTRTTLWAHREVLIENLDRSTQYHFDVRAFNGEQESQADACFVDATTSE